MSSIVLRKCNSEKVCSNCNNPILVGQNYFAGSYKALCVPCHENEIKGVVDSGKSTDNGYILTGNCYKCDKPAVGILWDNKVCVAHINDLMMAKI